MSYSDVQKLALFEKQICLISFLFDYFFLDYFFAKKKKAIPFGNFKTESSGPRLRGCWKMDIINWKLTKIKLAKNESRHQETQGESREKEREI